MTFSWTSSGADYCTSEGNTYPTSGSGQVGPYAAGSYSATVSCTGATGTTSKTVYWSAVEPTPTVSASASPSVVIANSGLITVNWNSTNTDYCVSDGTTFPTGGSIQFGPYAPGSYSASVSCTGAGGTVSKTVYWSAIIPAPTVSVSVSPSVVEADVGLITFSWSSTNANSCSSGGTTYATSGSMQFGPYAEGNYSDTVTCTGDGGSISKTAYWSSAPPTPPTVTVSVSESVVEANVELITFSWNSTDADSCASGGITYPTSGSLEFGPYAEGSYTESVTCTGPGGTASGSVSWIAIIPAGPQPGTGQSGIDCSAYPAAPNQGYTLSDGSHLVVVTGSLSGSSWGSGPYWELSTIAKSAIHAGAVAEGQSALINLGITGPMEPYSGSSQNGVSSAGLSNGYGYGSFTISLVGACGSPAPDSPQNISSTANPSTTGSYTLNWTASSTGATPEGYIVTENGVSLPIPATRAYTDTSLSIREK